MKSLKNVLFWLAVVTMGATILGAIVVGGIFIETLAGKVMPQPDVPGAAIVVWVVETFHFRQAVEWIDRAAMSGLLPIIIVAGFAAFHLRKLIRAMLPWVLILASVAIATVTLTVGTAGGDVNANLAFCAMMLLGGLFLFPQKKPQRQYHR